MMQMLIHYLKVHVLMQLLGCLNPLYVEFNIEANIDDEPSLCSDLIIYGCTDSEAANFNELANTR